MAQKRIDIYIVNDPKMKNKTYSDLARILNRNMIVAIKEQAPEEFDYLKKIFNEVV